MVFLNQPIFDGTEQDFYNFSSQIHCLSCNGLISFMPCDSLALDTLDFCLTPALLKAFQLQRIAHGGYKDIHGLTVYAIQTTCPACSNPHIILVGVGEIQPGRFKVVITGIVQQ